MNLRVQFYRSKIPETKLLRRWTRFAARTLLRSLLALLTLGNGLSPVQWANSKEDYLTDREVEQLRDAQDPDQRVKLLEEFLRSRLEKARALKIPQKATTEAETKETTSKQTKAKQTKARETNAKKGSQKSESPGTQEEAPKKTFAELMEEYLQCTEEAISNIENYSTLKIEPKAYVKSLKKLDQSVEEQKKWLEEMPKDLTKSETDRLNDASDALAELAKDIKEEIEKINEEMKQVKESKKSKPGKD